jgi:N-dimethylarginine dimethylaminohydrolase
MDLKDKYEKQGPVKFEDIEMEYAELNIGYTDEYSKLTAVALHIPRRKEVVVQNPKSVMFQETPNYLKLLEEVDSYRKLLKSLDIKVIDDASFIDADKYGPFHNLIYMRDLGVVTHDRLLLANPKYDIRKGEQEIMLTTLRRSGYIGPYMDLPNDITMEGADFFWINEKKVLISVGNRTSPEFAEIFGKLYPDIEVQTVEAAPEGVPQHILGGAHIVDKDTIIQRKSIIKHDLGFSKVIELDENNETINGFAMNIVTVGPMEIIMPEGNPFTKTLYELHGIKVHTTPCYEIYKMGGAIACMTLPLTREK